MERRAIVMFRWERLVEFFFVFFSPLTPHNRGKLEAIALLFSLSNLSLVLFSLAFEVPSVV